MSEATGSFRSQRPGFYEFFCGGGMARAGLGPQWRCLLANDNDAVKGQIYQDNWGPEALRVQGVETLSVTDLPYEKADLAWASFPCQDLSLAGPGGGLAGKRSSCFWPFWNLMLQLRDQGRQPRAVVLENVTAALSSHGGRDFEAICRALTAGGYKFGALVIDAALFLPQSRPRLFIIALQRDERPQPEVVSDIPVHFHTTQVQSAWLRLPPALKEHWVWWRIPLPTHPVPSLESLLLPDEAVDWHSSTETARLLSLMNAAHLQKVEDAKSAGIRTVGAAYRRTRTEGGIRKQRAEIRFDGLAGCLRTPQGGSSRQTLVVIENGELKSRLLTARESARLMGLPDTYRLPRRETAGLHLTGDGVVVPVVRYLSQHLFEPLLADPVPLTIQKI